MFAIASGYKCARSGLIRAKGGDALVAFCSSVERDRFRLCAATRTRVWRLPCDYERGDGCDSMKAADSPLMLTIFALQVAAILENGVHAAYRNGYSSPRTCERDGECDILLGEVCRWGYAGCTLGQCRCRAGEQLDVRKNRCTPRRLGQETCDPRKDQCIQGMECVDSMCQCSTGEMTLDRTFCLRRNQGLLGGSCRRSKDCLQESPAGYTSADVECSNGICQCERGLKQNNLRCQKRKIGEHGCTANDHCYGGALCRDSTCTCPPRYTVTSGGTKCARREARLELALGDRCNEIDETGYCARGLICHNCAGSKYFTCVRATTGDYLNGGSTKCLDQRLLFGLVSFIMTLLLVSR